MAVALATGLLVLVTCIAVVAGKGGGGRSLSQTPAASALSQAAYVTTRSPGFKFSLDVSATVSGHPFSLDGEGSLDERSHEGTLHMEVAGEQISELIKSPYIYVQLPAAALAAGGKPWVRVNLQSFAKALGAGNPFAQDTSPSQVLGMLDASGQVSTLGSAVVRGVHTTHYRGLIDYTRYASQLTGEAQKAMQKTAQLLERVTGSSSLPLDVWVDGQGRVRRLATEVKLGTAAGVLSETVNMELFNFGPQPAVVLPPESEVSEETSALGAST